MSKDKLEDWDETAANNLDMGGISLAENVMRPPAVNNEMREHMAQVAKWLGDETLASGTTTDLGSVPGRYISVTGTTTITGLGTIKAGTLKYVKFAGILTLTHNATSLILPGAANITTAAGDAAVFVSEGSGNWRCIGYQRASGTATIPAIGAMDTRRNRVVNGDMRVSQENGTTSGTTTGFYPVDQWAQEFVTSAGTLTVAQVASVTPAGSPNRLRATVTVADASLAAGEYWKLFQKLEGSNVADFRYGGASAKASVLRFGFKGPAGTYAVALHNSAANRSFVALFTIAAPDANTDTVQTIAITGDASGTWLTADGVIGITLDIVLACGSTFQGAAGWQAGLIYGTSGVSNGMGTGSAVFELFDVGLKLDPDATGVYGVYEVADVDPVYRPERYYYKLNFLSGEAIASLLAYGSTSALGPISIQSAIPMSAATKVVTNSGLANFSLTTAAGITAAVTTNFILAANAAGGIRVSQADRTGGGLVAGNVSVLTPNATSWIAVSARL